MPMDRSDEKAETRVPDTVTAAPPGMSVVGPRKTPLGPAEMTCPATVATASAGEEAAVVVYASDATADPLEFRAVPVETTDAAEWMIRVWLTTIITDGSNSVTGSCVIVRGTVAAGSRMDVASASAEFDAERGAGTVSPVVIIIVPMCVV